MSSPTVPREIYSVPAIATYVGTGVSVWAVAQHYLLLAVVAMSLVICLLLIYLFFTHKKYRIHRRFRQIDSELHKLAHRTRDYVSELRMAGNVNEARQFSGAAIKHALTVASNCFSRLIGKPCSASLMLRVSHDMLTTVQYCYNTDPQRESRRSSPLPISDGIAGKALTSGDVVVWTKGDPTFIPTRQDFGQYYQSGICVPFQASLTYVGLLNVDTKDENMFSYDMHKQIGAAIGDTIGLIIDALNLWEDSNGKKY